jgi:hypothetical protein
MKVNFLSDSGAKSATPWCNCSVRLFRMLTDENDPPHPAADAVSLHTIVDRVAYAVQKQEDADYTLAFSLEEEEEARTPSAARSAAQAQTQEVVILRERKEHCSHQRTEPFRDDIEDGNAAGN